MTKVAATADGPQSHTGTEVRVPPETRPGSLPPRRGYAATKPQLQGRLAKVEGQVRGIAKMVEEDRYCMDILTQISAVRAALDKVALGLLDDHARHCLLGGGGPTDPDAQVAELMGAVGRLLAR